MEIYVVKSGDSLYKIAQTFDVNINSLASINGLSLETPLVIGQALLIPKMGTFYTVKEGDTLFKIGRMFNVNYETIAKANNLAVLDALKVGMKLFIPPRDKTEIETNAYVEPLTDPVSQELIDEVTNKVPYLTYLSPFSFQIKRDGTLQDPPLNNFVEIAQQAGTTIMLSVTNLEKGMFSADLAEVILTNPSLQDKLISEIITKAKNLLVTDVHFDLEFIPPYLRTNYLTFLQKAKTRLNQNDLLMSVALAPKISATQVGEWYEAHDYASIGQIADFVVIMTYEWGYVAGPPMPVSPLPEVRKVIEYALTVIPSNKIMLGQNLYGYDWTLPYTEGTYATTLSPLGAVDLARNVGATINYDYSQQAPYFNYYDNNKNEHIVWFEDVRSIQAKFDLVKELNLRGISYWKLGFPFPQNWVLLEDNFIIKKR